MRTGLWISVFLLAVTLVFGWWEERSNQEIARRYTSAAEEIRALSEIGDWNRAQDTAAAYMADWQRMTAWLQMLINHEDIDDVTLALVKLQAAIHAQEQSACYEACAELKENARHIYHRDAFLVGNVL